MVLTRSNSGLVRAPGFIVSPVGKRERRGGRKKSKKQTNKQTNKKNQRWEGGKKEIGKEEREEGGKKD